MNANIIILYNEEIKENQGFTLVELSIVLVIIALIISGILVGQDLIHGAEVRATITQIDRYNAANNAFRLRYNALPGDFAQAGIYINGATSGDGNGLLGDTTPQLNTPALTGGAGQTYTFGAGTSTNEVAQYWYQLSQLGLIEGTFNGTVANYTLGTNFPYTKINKGGVFAYGNFGDSNNYYHLGLANSSTTASACINIFSPQDAEAIDSKMDDGLPNTGIAVARGGTKFDFTATSGVLASQNCVNTSTANTYNNAAGTSLLCQIRIRMN